MCKVIVAIGHDLITQLKVFSGPQLGHFLHRIVAHAQQLEIDRVFLCRVIRRTSNVAAETATKIMQRAG
jgi:hypothetical protein